MNIFYYAQDNPMKHTLSVLLQNKPGVLSRVTGLFSGRGFNIKSLSVAETLDSSLSCLTLVTTGNDAIVEQITKQLHKLIDVIKWGIINPNWNTWGRGGSVTSVNKDSTRVYRV